MKAKSKLSIGPFSIEFDTDNLGVIMLILIIISILVDIFAYIGFNSFGSNSICDLFTNDISRIVVYCFNCQRMEKE